MIAARMQFPGSCAYVPLALSTLAPCCRELCSNSCLGRPGNSPPVPEVVQVGHPPPFSLSKARWIASLRATCLTLAGPATAAAIAFFGMVVVRGMCAKGCVQSTHDRCAAKGAQVLPILGAGVCKAPRIGVLPKGHKCCFLCQFCYTVFVLYPVDLIWYTYDIYILSLLHVLGISYIIYQIHFIHGLFYI